MYQTFKDITGSTVDPDIHRRLIGDIPFSISWAIDEQLLYPSVDLHQQLKETAGNGPLDP